MNALSDESCSGLRRDALISAAFTALGYEALGPFGLPGRLYFRKSAPDGTRLVQAHAYVSGDPAIARHLAFRDLLRADPAARAAYAHVKHTADQTARGNIARYMDLKDAFIKRTERIALLKFPNAADTPQF